MVNIAIEIFIPPKGYAGVEYIEIPSEYKRHASAIGYQGLVFQAEFLSTKEISFTLSDKRKEEDLLFKIVPMKIVDNDVVIGAITHLMDEALSQKLIKISVN